MIPELCYERRISFENPGVSFNDEGAWDEAFGIHVSSSGVRVSGENALTHDAWWRGISLVSNYVAKLPCVTYKRVGEGKDRDASHPAYSLLLFEPNSEMTAFTWFQISMNHVISRGNAYSYILRGGDSRPLELLPMDPQVTYPVRENGNLLYVTKVDTEWRKLLPENVLHLKGLGYDGLCGYSVVSKAADSLGLAIGGREYQSRYLKNNARPSAIIEVPGPMQRPAQEELLRQWNNMHQGIENSHRTAILTGGAKLNAYSINARDSQLIETRKLSILEISNWLGLPPHKLGDSSRTSYNSLEQEEQAFLNDTLDPWLVTWEQECRRKLLSEREKAKDSHVIEFLRQAMLKADINARYNAYNIAVNAGIMSIDEVRSRENMNPLPDGLGQQHRAPLNMGVLESGEDEPEDPPDAQQLANIVKDIVAKQLPPDAAKVIIQQAFPSMPDADVSKIVNSAKAFEAPEPEPVAGPAVGDDEPPEEPVEDERQSWVKALRPAIEEDVATVSRRMRKHLLSKVGKADFLSHVSAAVVEYYDYFKKSAAKQDGLRTKVAVQTKSGFNANADDLISTLLGSLEEDLRALFSRVEPKGLPAAIESRLMDYELSLSQQIADRLLEQKP